MSEPLLSVNHLSVSFGSKKRRLTAVDGISFSLGKGETLSLVGESGCGKSVTALSLLRLLPEPPASIDGGSAWFKNKNLLELSSKEMRGIRGREMAMIFQEPMTCLNPVFTVGEQVAEAVRIHGKVSRKAGRELAVEAMSRVGIPASDLRYEDYPHQLSGGMRQRVMIAMALACSPEVLIADEPTTALDVTIQAQILELIGKLQAQTDMGVILITHDLGVVAEVADRVAVLYAGSIVEMAEARELFANPLHPYTQALYQSIPQSGSSGKRLSAIPGRVPELGAIPAHCRFYDRCPVREDRCQEVEPELAEAAPHHKVRCIKVHGPA